MFLRDGVGESSANAHGLKNGACMFQFAFLFVFPRRESGLTRELSWREKEGHVDVKHYRWGPKDKMVTTWVDKDAESRQAGSRVGDDVDALKFIANAKTSHAFLDGSSVTPGLESSST